MEILVFEKWPNIAVVSVVHPSDVRRRQPFYPQSRTEEKRERERGTQKPEELTAEVWFVFLPKPNRCEVGAAERGNSSSQC